MNVEEIVIDPAVAERKLEATRRQLGRAHNPEYESLERAYAAAAEGQPLIQLSLAIRNAPRDDTGRPRLAIARADRRQVRIDVQSGRQRCVFDSSTGNSSRAQLRVDVPFDARHYASGFALVPMVPPDVLEQVAPRTDLRQYHILFEVERWADSRIGAQPDRDPYLLRFVDGDLWAVMAEWDLTDVERAVMAARAQS